MYTGYLLYAHKKSTAPPESKSSTMSEIVIALNGDGSKQKRKSRSYLGWNRAAISAGNDDDDDVERNISDC